MADMIEKANAQAENSVLDSFKETALRAEDLLEFLIDQIGGSEVQPDLSEEWGELLDTVRQTIVEGLGEHVDAARWDGIRAVYGPAAKVYDDGSPIVNSYQFRDGDRAVISHYPRVDGPLEEHVKKFLPRPTLGDITQAELAAADAADGTRVDEILDAALAGQLSDEHLQVVAHVSEEGRKSWSQVDAADIAYIAAQHPNKDILINLTRLHGTFGAAFGPAE